MTAVVTGTPALARPAESDAHPAERAAFVWAWRLIRRGAFYMWLTVSAYMVLEVVSYRRTYPDAAARQKLIELSSSAFVRMMQGMATAIDTAPGFAVWDGGWMLMLIVGCWSALTVTRLVRGEEDAGRYELIGSRVIRPTDLLLAVFGAMGVGLFGVAASAALPLIAFGAPIMGAVAWGLSLAMFGVTITALGALTAHMSEPRKRAASFALAMLAGAFLLRVVANSDWHRVWMLSLTPFGWVDHVRSFGDTQWAWLLLPVVSSALMALVAALLSRQRDLGSAVLAARRSRRSRLYLLNSATAFGWRLTSGALMAWATGLFATSVVFGLLVDVIAKFIEDDESYRRLLESLGMDMSAPIIGFASYLATFIAMPVAMFLGWRLGAFRQEEAEGRLDNLLVRKVERTHLLAATAALAMLAAVALIAASGFGLWLGAVLVNGDLSASQALRPFLGIIPVAAFFTGLTTAIFGLVPRLTVGVTVTVAVLSYVLEMFGAMLDWPTYIVGLSPFDHLAKLPAEPMTTSSIVVLSALGVVTTLVGLLAYRRRDAQGA